LIFSQRSQSWPIFGFLFLLRKFVEYLLDCRLLYGILLNEELLLVGLEELEQFAHLCLRLYLQSDERLQSLEQLHFSEFRSDAIHDFPLQSAHLQKLYDCEHLNLLSGFQRIVNKIARTALRHLQPILRNHFQSSKQLLKFWLLDDTVILEFVVPDDCFDMTLLQVVEFDLNLEAFSVLALDVLWRADALEISLDHYAQSRGEGLSFFHRVGSENHCAVLLLSGDSRDDLPHESPCLGVHSSRRFIQEDDPWVSYHCHGHRQLSFVAARKSPRQFISVFFEVHLFNLLGDGSVLVLRLKRLHVVEHFQLLSDCEILDEGIKLRTVPQSFPDFLQVLTDLQPVEIAVPAC